MRAEVFRSRASVLLSVIESLVALAICTRELSAFREGGARKIRRGKGILYTRIYGYPYSVRNADDFPAQQSSKSHVHDLHA
jgi:hypothetical protein